MINTDAYCVVAICCNISISCNSTELYGSNVAHKVAEHCVSYAWLVVLVFETVYKICVQAILICIACDNGHRFLAVQKRGICDATGGQKEELGRTEAPRFEFECRLQPADAVKPCPMNFSDLPSLEGLMRWIQRFYLLCRQSGGEMWTGWHGRTAQKP